MAQNYIQMSADGINWTTIRQPDSGLSYNFETTYTADSTRTTSGDLPAKSMFTIEQYGYSASRVSASEMSTILGFIVRGRPFYLRHFSPVSGNWVSNRQFYVGKGELNIGSLSENCEYFEELSFNMTSCKPI